MFSQNPDGFYSRFYDLSMHFTPLLAWGFLGPVKELNEICFSFKVSGFLIFSFDFLCFPLIMLLCYSSFSGVRYIITFCSRFETSLSILRYYIDLIWSVMILLDRNNCISINKHYDKIIESIGWVLYLTCRLLICR